MQVSDGWLKNEMLAALALLPISRDVPVMPWLPRRWLRRPAWNTGAAVVPIKTLAMGQA